MFMSKIGPELEIGLREVFKSSLAKIVYDSKGNCVFINESAIKLLGYKLCDMKNRSIYTFIEGNEEYKVTSAQKKDVAEPYDLKVITRDGNVKIVSATGLNIEYDKEIYRVSSMYDKTEEVFYYEKIQKNRKIIRMSAISDVLFNISHDWRQVLSVVSTIVTGIATKIEYGLFNDNNINEIAKDLYIVNSKVQDISKTLNIFTKLSTSSNEKTNVLLIDLFDLSYETLKSSFIENSISLNRDFNTNNNIKVFENEIQRLFTILLKNSEDVLKSKNIDKPKVCIKIYEKGENQIFMISDNGGGIDENIINNIFEPYFTTKHKFHGTGLGLFEAKKIVEDISGGTIEVRNTKLGAEFKIILPY